MTSSSQKKMNNDKHTRSVSSLIQDKGADNATNDNRGSDESSSTMSISESHPLFLDSLPSDFMHHAGLSAIASLMSQDDEHDAGHDDIHSMKKNTWDSNGYSKAVSNSTCADHDASTVGNDSKPRSKRQSRKQQIHPYSKSTTSQAQRRKTVPLLDKTSYVKQHNDATDHEHVNDTHPPITMNDETTDKLVEQRTAAAIEKTSTNEATLFLQLWKI
jgi:hypothetical protein